MLTERSQVQEVLFTPGTRNTEEFYTEFTRLYHELKAAGYRPSQIQKELMSFIDCSKSSYIRYLRYCRRTGLISDTFEESWATRKDVKIEPLEKAVRDRIAKEIQTTSATPPPKPTPSLPRVVNGSALQLSLTAAVNKIVRGMNRVVTKLKYKE